MQLNRRALPFETDSTPGLKSVIPKPYPLSILGFQPDAQRAHASESNQFPMTSG